MSNAEVHLIVQFSYKFFHECQPRFLSIYSFVVQCLMSRPFRVMLRKQPIAVKTFFTSLHFKSTNYFKNEKMTVTLSRARYLSNF